MANTKKAFLIALFAVMSATSANAQWALGDKDRVDSKPKTTKIKKPSKKQAKIIKAEIEALQKDSIVLEKARHINDSLLNDNMDKLTPLLPRYEKQKNWAASGEKFAFLAWVFTKEIQPVEDLKNVRAILERNAFENIRMRNQNTYRLEQKRAELNGEVHSREYTLSVHQDENGKNVTAVDGYQYRLEEGESLQIDNGIVTRVLKDSIQNRR
ncbi:MAG: hypothetical protein LBF37_02915 [Rickettsiales bacterium]|jgi:hypothetical protein|nr:hypothetical protein [Rickettsiales bacterium]